MQYDDIPILTIQAQPSGAVAKMRKQTKKGTALRYALWPIGALTVCAWSLTIMRYTGALQRLAQAIINAYLG